MVLAYGRNKETDAKYFIEYRTDKNVRSLFITPPKMSEFVNEIEEIRHISFVIKDEKGLKRHESIWNKIRNMVGNKFDEKIVFKGQYLNTKLKSYNSKIKTKNSYCFCLTAIVHDSVCKKKNENDEYDPQIYLEECRY